MLPVCSVHFSCSESKEDKRHNKGSQLRKCYRRESNSSSHGGIICMSVRQLPYSCNSLLIFMSQTDQRQLSPSLLCITFSSLSNTHVCVQIFCMCNLHSSGTLTWKLGILHKNPKTDSIICNYSSKHFRISLKIFWYNLEIIVLMELSSEKVHCEFTC